MKPETIEVEPGVFSAVSGGVSHEVRVDSGVVWIDGTLYAYDPIDKRAWRRTGSAGLNSAHASIVAPMPGKVVRVLAATGDSVEAGQAVVVVEAMKMQNELRAPRAGVLSAVNAKPGDSVNAGAVLAVLD